MREGTLSGVARALGLTQPTAGRHISELEPPLDTGALFTRSARGLQPKEIALALASHKPERQRYGAALNRRIRSVSAVRYGVPSLRKTSWNQIVGSAST